MPPTSTSADPQQPTPLVIVPGTLVVDRKHELAGTVIAVAPAFCVLQVEDALCVSPWRDVAVGNVAPAPEMLPGEIAEHDRLNGHARVLRELEALKSEGLVPALQVAYDDVLRRLRDGSAR